jgi:hypothetical protein
LAEARAIANAATNHAARAALTNHAGLIWAIADLLRGDYKQSEYGRVILPLVLLRRLDCVLEPTKAQVLARVKTVTVQTVGPVLKTVTGIEAYNTSRLNLRAILADPGQVAGNLRAWIAAFDADTRDVIEKFDFDAQIGRLDRAKLLYLVLSNVTDVDLRPDKVTNVEMGYLYQHQGETTKDGRRTDGLACGRKNGRRPADVLPAGDRSGDRGPAYQSAWTLGIGLLHAPGQLHRPAAPAECYR